MSITVKDKEKIIHELDNAFNLATSNKKIDLASELIEHLDLIFDKIDTATSGFSNILTCLICSVVDSSIDPRYHRQPGNGMPSPSNDDGWFSGRTISEKILYPWMVQKGFRTAKSGWQTRTYERPNPYNLNYPENIAEIKNSFLKILDYASKNKDKCLLMVSYLFRREIIYMNQKNQLIDKLAKNNYGNEILIADIIKIMNDHFSLPSSSHLPVIALYSIYQLLINEIDNYKLLSLKPLESHQASDLRTGAIGDIELEDEEGDVIEALEIKHNIEIEISILLRAKEKIMKSNVKRYYILTTHKNCGLENEEIVSIIRDVYKNHGCQIITNGVMPTLKYYLRLIDKPMKFLIEYTKNISEQKDVTTSQLNKWSELTKDIIS